MKILYILLSIILLFTNVFAANDEKEATTIGLSSGEITNNIINVNVNGMVCDFCAQSIEKVFMKIDEIKGIKINLENQKVTLYLKLETNIEDETISTIFEDVGYTVERINRTS
jgi:copper chaperone CopZ